MRIICWGHFGFIGQRKMWGWEALSHCNWTWPEPQYQCAVHSKGAKHSRGTVTWTVLWRTWKTAVISSSRSKPWSRTWILRRLNLNFRSLQRFLLSERRDVIMNWKEGNLPCETTCHDVDFSVLEIIEFLTCFLVFFQEVVNLMHFLSTC